MEERFGDRAGAQSQHERSVTGGITSRCMNVREFGRVISEVRTSAVYATHAPV